MTDQDGVAVVKTTQDKRRYEFLHHTAVDIVFQLSQPGEDGRNRCRLVEN